jgi:hypothetical protein
VAEPFATSPGASVVELPQPRAVILRPFRPIGPARVPSLRTRTRTRTRPGMRPQRGPGIQPSAEGAWATDALGHRNRPIPPRRTNRISRAPSGRMNLSPHHPGHRSSNSLSPGLCSSGPSGRPDRLDASPFLVLVLVLDPDCVPTGKPISGANSGHCVPNGRDFLGPTD